MFDLITILDEHRELMLERGYKEIGLGTAEEPKPDSYKQQLEDFRTEDPRFYIRQPDEDKVLDPGIYMKQLEEQFSFHIKESLFKKGIREFDVKAVGFFNEEKHIVNFSFHYELDKRNKKIELKSFKAEMEGVTKEFILHRNMYQLPHVSKVISALVKEQERLNAETPFIADTTENLGTIPSHRQVLDEHQKLLEEKGYTDKYTFPYSNNFLINKINAKVINRYYDTYENQDFQIRAHGFFNDQNDEVHFTFFYEINQNEKKLNLNSLVAELNEKRICYPIKELNDLPAAGHVYKHLTNELKEEQAQIIYPKEQIKIVLREQDRFLGSIGYYKTILSHTSDFLKGELQGRLENSLQENELQTIAINRQIHISPGDSMQCLFQYAFDPVQVSLKLEKITATVGGVLERTYLIKEECDKTLTIQNIYEELEQQKRLLKAHTISKAPEENKLNRNKTINRILR